MQAQLSAIAFVAVALSAAYFLTRSIANERWHNAGFVLWFVSAAILFLLLGSKEFSLIVLVALLVFLTPRPPEQKLPFLVLIFFAVPVAIKAAIPFPAINYLFNVDFQVLIGMVAVAPALIGGQRPERTIPQSIGWGTIFMLAYFTATTLLMFRVLPFTATLRFGVEAILGVFLIYLLILRFAVSESVLERTMTALYTATVILACIALMSQLKRWNLYSLLDTDARIFKAAQVRYGILRTDTTVNSVLFGFIEAVGIVLLLRRKQIWGTLPKYGWLMGLLLTMGFIVSMSRGAWLAGFVAISAYFLLNSRLSSSVIVAIVMSSVVCLAYLVFSGAGISQDLDPFQTFDYRKQLYAASWDQFHSAPFLGNPFYLNSGRFDELVQGEGIVDVVSVYLQMALQFGLVGLVLYVAPFLISLVGILRLRTRTVDLKSRTLIASLGAFILGYLALISTVSGVNLIIHFGFILVALANAAIVVANQQLETPVNSETEKLFPAQPGPIRRPNIPVRRAPGRGRNHRG
ncbi:MAG: O-antigen ligase family protein [Aestuariivirga sp.]|nr:O-antigen ligase family protein [Aestuariivirga sp.]